MTRPLIAALATALGACLPAVALAQPGSAEPAYTKTVEGSFDDVAFALEQAITAEGLVVDATNQVGDMLARTKADVGGTKDLFTHATIYSFCSARVSRQAMEADLAAVQYCPYGVFAYETPEAPGRVVVGHRVYPGPALQPVNALLDRLVDAAAE